MKILNEGDVKIGKWWIGMDVTCEVCGRKVELEEHDDQHALWMPCQHEQDVVRVLCETCNKIMEMRRPPKE